MADEELDFVPSPDSPTDLSRREFVAMSVAAASPRPRRRLRQRSCQSSKTNVEIKTPDGTCDAAFIHPANGAHPGVLIWPDAFGLRPVDARHGKRLAAEGYSVLVPNPFYRVGQGAGVRGRVDRSIFRTRPTWRSSSR